MVGSQVVVRGYQPTAVWLHTQWRRAGRCYKDVTVVTYRNRVRCNDRQGWKHRDKAPIKILSPLVIIRATCNKTKRSCVLPTQCIYVFRLILTIKCMASGFRRDVDYIRSLLGHYAAQSGNSQPKFPNNLSVPSSRTKNSSHYAV